MDTFYKYTTNFGASFFKKPKVKISNPSYLNDPFESEPGDNLVQVINEGLIRAGADVIQLDTKNMTDQMLKSNGIFSVSETPRSPLMWAHYADEHRGMCIGYSKDIFCNVKKPTGNEYLLSQYVPQKINYDNYRYDRQRSVNNADDFIAAVKSSLFTKSDDWLYEKEHRCIIPFICSTSFSVNTNNKNTTSHFSSEMTINIYLKRMLSKGVFRKINKNEYTFTPQTEEAHYLALSSFGCVSFLYEIDPKHIHSIHLGLRFPDEDLIKLYEMIKMKKSKISHVRLYKFKLSTKRFELLPDIVDHTYISQLSSINKM